MSLSVPNYGCYCPTCFQFVPDKELVKISDEAKRDRTTIRWQKAFAEVYGVPFWMVQGWGIRPGISVLAGQVMANQMRRDHRKRVGNGARLNRLKTIFRVPAKE